MLKSVLHPKVIAVVLALGIIVLGVVLVQLVYRPGSAVEGPLAPETPRSNVAVFVLSEESIVERLTLPGALEAWEDILLAARNSGPIESLGVEEGKPVVKGQEVARIDAAVLQQTLRSAEAAEALAEANYRRIRELKSQDVSSAGELDQAQSELDQAKAAVAIARQNLSDATLQSPITGMVDELPLDVGEFVNRGETIARLVDVSRVKVRLNVPEKDVNYFVVGQAARVENPEAVRGFSTGTITRIALVADDLSRTFPLEVTVDNDEGIFRPGMISKVDLVRRSHDAAIVIPVFALLQTEDGPMVYLEEEGRAVMRAVTVGIRQGSRVEITEGLRAGDRLIVEGQRNLSDGELLRVMEVRER